MNRPSEAGGGRGLAARLGVPAGGNPERLRYAAGVLLELAGIESALEEDGNAPWGLEMHSGFHVETEVLDRVFREVSLEREIESGRTDRHGRFPEEAADWDLSDPWVSRLARQLAEAAGSDRPRGFTVVVSHDIDWVTTLEPASLVKSARSTFLRAGPPWIGLRRSLDPALLQRNFERLLRLEQGRGVQPLVFMLSGPWGLGRFSTRYDCRWGSARRMIACATQAGAAVGLHGSYRAREKGTYRFEAKRLSGVCGRPLWAHRNHYLRFDPRNLWYELERAGIAWDFSVGFPNRIGVRVPVAQPFRAYDWNSEKAGRVVTVPLVFMDSAHHLRDQDETLGSLRRLLQSVQDVAGCVSVLFHPENFAVDERWFDFTARILDLCEALGASFDLNLKIHGDSEMAPKDGGP